ncbi:Lrp/AsnC family transcriptional regulator [Candidatus Woesearchaeota archaeon]|jgi:DNA-binding Lrp family transcriptional regulator|nr:Lrp/AsnC family transcriptional regulator [Candidatus Woesearchaeota archaeon]MBT3538229.1 Lrp/AsnC family transcriptional regulator [Candidatus Woesearchaeota archaeon]MBT4696799.1 Lrp/AsnC family transcriptional regulator [Candidatus Woesearchaeota archaeon]MBT4717246.1 Lrp/AsnC family transcriptional regulator [Candidatus Woesearchaeota archaeon]MBT7105898.1 Lrp/AsnC family transcriptional regulator [Candidatus Woesearchaeota archaeon]
MVYDMDDKDLAILDVLKENGDYTTRQIAKKTLLPPTTIHNRIRKLKSEGIIRKFTVDVDPSKVGKGFLSYILVSVNLGVLKRQKKTQYDIAEKLRKFYFVERVDIVSGGTDIVAVVRVKDVSEFDDILLGKLQLVEGVEKTQSLIAIHSRDVKKRK